MLRLLDDEGFRRGLRVGGAVGASLIALLYALVATTHDIRARILILLGASSGLWLVLVAAFVLAGLCALVFTGRPSGRSLLGVVTSAFLMNGLLATGAPARVIPDIHTAEVGIAWSVVIGLGVLGELWWERRRSRRSAQPQDAASSTS